MIKPPANTRIMITGSWNTKFILPEGTSADLMSVLANAIPINDFYHGGKNHIYRECSDNKIEIKIISTNEISNFIDGRNEDHHPEYDIIISEIREQLGKKTHATIIFKENEIVVGKKTFNYADLASPETDPEKLINDIVEVALKDVGREI